jgi:ribonuclease BN (tRNA processing enzyme)
VLGARGSTTVAGPQYRRFGGGTTCLVTEAGPRHYLVIDSGAGIRDLQSLVPAGEPLEFSLFLTHYHWDHIEGLPTFFALDDPRHRLTIYGPSWDGSDVGEVLDRVIRPPWFPVSLRERPAAVMYREVVSPIRVGRLTVHAVGLSHPQGSTGYRLDAGGRSVVIATDHEAGTPEVDALLAEAAEGTDVLIHDGQYLPEEYRANRTGWGHSTWEGAVAAAHACRAGRLVLTSHDPARSDDQVDDIVRLARAQFPLTSAAYPGLRIPL